MEEALPAAAVPDEPTAMRLRVKLRYRDEWQRDRLSASEIDVLGSHLPELLGELLQLTYEQKAAE